jgi:hypothetical protein
VHISSIGYGTSVPIQRGGRHLCSDPCPPPKLLGGVDSGSTFMSMWYLRARLQVGGSTSLQVGVLVVEPIGLPGYLVSWPWYHLAT